MSEPKVIASTVTDREYIFEGPIAVDIKNHLMKNGTTQSIGWVSTLEYAVNFSHVVHVEFQGFDD